MSNVSIVFEWIKTQEGSFVIRCILCTALLCLIENCLLSNAWLTDRSEDLRIATLVEWLYPKVIIKSRFLELLRVESGLTTADHSSQAVDKQQKMTHINKPLFSMRISPRVYDIDILNANLSDKIHFCGFLWCTIWDARCAFHTWQSQLTFSPKNLPWKFFRH